MKVNEVMTANPGCCTPDSQLTEVAKMMVSHDCGLIPVVENQTNKVPVGVITDRDIVRLTVAKDRNPLDLTAADCMTQPVVTVTPTTSVEDCCRSLEEKKIRRVLVVDESGACVGIVALADIALQARDSFAGGVVKEVSEPAKSTGATAG